MRILGIETSCDETGAAIIEGKPRDHKVKLISNITSSSLSLHSKTGGIIPEIASREQIKYIIPVIKKTIENCKLKIEDLDAIAVTIGPGLIGSLLVGVETARTLAYVWRKPIIPVNHLVGHIYANFVSKIQDSSADIKFPLIGLVVSGGHTDLVYMEKHKRILWLGGTLDDAAGEALDKIGRLLSIPYPGGPHIEEHAKNGNPNRFNFPRPMIGSPNFDFSFSGLKTAVFRKVKEIQQSAPSREGFSAKTIADLCASSQQAIIDVLVKKTLDAARKYRVKSILLSGGVAANSKLREQFELKIKNEKLKIPLFFPEKRLCTDNAAMIASAGFFNYAPLDWRKVCADPELYFA